MKMTSSDFERAAECPVCGASLPAQKKYTRCPACGSPLPEASGFTGRAAASRQGELDEMLGLMNERLMDTGAEISDRAFNLGCGLGFFLLVTWGIAVYFIGGRSWLLVIISLVIFSLAVLWIVVLISDIARNRAMQRVYREQIKPELEEYGRTRRILIEEIETSAFQALPERSPLLKFIPAPPEVELSV